MPTTQYRIHPGIGIARIGNSQESFIGPEVPGDVPWPGTGGYRDSEDRLKRQAARFRIYEVTIDDSGRELVQREVTSADAAITWRVHLANTKAAGEVFPPNGVLRNKNHANRDELSIDGGQTEIAGNNQQSSAISGTFKAKSVFLGELKTDSAGRLLVLGGHGDSASVPAGRPITSFANNNDWHDDLCDGPVTATITLADGSSVDAVSAWVVVASPAFAPGIDNPMTWEDQVDDVAAYHFNPSLRLEPVSFTRHIYPILKRTVQLRWVSSNARSGHGEGRRGDFLNAARLASLASDAPADASARQAVFARLTAPPEEPTSGGNMPQLQRGVNPDNPQTRVQTSLTQLQYERMAAWARGDFIADWNGSEPARVEFDTIAAANQPEALDRAALRACIGGPFFPGIESGYLMARSDTYSAAGRIDSAHPPGFLTQRMALPWQADYVACGALWWPAQRPVSVKRGSEFANFAPSDWEYADMIENWSKLGVILESNGEFIEHQSLLNPGSPVPPPPEPGPDTPTWTGEVSSYFNQMEIGCMSFKLDLGSYEDVKAFAPEILRRVRLQPSDAGFMPKGGRPWPAGKIERFEAWIQGGCPND